MADCLNAAALFFALTLIGAAHADIADPTRPPAGYAEPELASIGANSPKEPGLNVSSLFLMGDRPYAVVDGQIVRPGDPLADGRVAGIDARGVWIARPDKSKRLLKWLPEVNKTPARTPPRARMEKK